MENWKILESARSSIIYLSDYVDTSKLKAHCPIYYIMQTKREDTQGISHVDILRKSMKSKFR